MISLNAYKDVLFQNTDYRNCFYPPMFSILNLMNIKYDYILSNDIFHYKKENTTSKIDLTLSCKNIINEYNIYSQVGLKVTHISTDNIFSTIEKNLALNKYILIFLDHYELSNSNLYHTTHEVHVIALINNTGNGYYAIDSINNSTRIFIISKQELYSSRNSYEKYFKKDDIPDFYIFEKQDSINEDLNARENFINNIMQSKDLLYSSLELIPSSINSLKEILDEFNTFLKNWNLILPNPNRFYFNLLANKKAEIFRNERILGTDYCKEINNINKDIYNKWKIIKLVFDKYTIAKSISEKSKQTLFSLLNEIYILENNQLQLLYKKLGEKQ